ncbi:MAG: tetratricopeptide repeat protein [Bryobacteraceae bacterium]|nr:tetratricopeptide repeat protein [Bryobacteraceae bacterium]
MTRYTTAQALLAICLILLTGCPSRAREDAARYLEKGKQALKEGRLNDASVDLRKAIQKNAGIAEAHYLYGVVEQRQESFGSAYRALSRATELDPGLLPARIALADVCRRLYLLDPERPAFLRDQWKSQLDAITRRAPESFDALRLGAYLALADDDRAKALRMFQRAEVVAPDQPEVGMAISQLLFEAGNAEEAAAKGWALIRKAPTYAPVYDVLYFQKLSRKDFEGAAAVLDAKARNNPARLDFAIQLAEHFWNTGASPLAETAIANALTAARERKSDFILIGDYFRRTRQFSKALSVYREGEQAASASGDRLLARDMARKWIEMLMVTGQTTQASTELRNLLREHPRYKEAQILDAGLALASADPGRTQAAESRIEKLTSEHGSDAGVWFLLGQARLALKDFNGARKAFTEAARRDKTQMEPRLSLLYLALEEGRFADGLTEAEGILKYHPERISVQVLRAVCNMGVGELGRARAELEAILRRAPGHRDAQLQMALLKLKEGKAQEAEAAFRDLLSNNDPTDLRSLEGLVQVLLRTGRCDPALELLKSAANRTPQSAAPILLAETSVACGRIGDGVEIYRKLAEAIPTSTDLRRRLAELLVVQGQPNLALPHLEQVIARTPRDIRARLQRAVALEQLERSEPAKQEYRDLLALQPDYPLALNNLAHLLAESGGDLEEALRMAQRALTRSPANPVFQVTLACVYTRKGLKDAALGVMEKLAASSPENANYQYHLAAVHAAGGERRKAQQHMMAGLNSNPNPLLRRKILMLQESMSR